MESVISKTVSHKSALADHTTTVRKKMWQCCKSVAEWCGVESVWSTRDDSVTCRSYYDRFGERGSSRFSKVGMWRLSRIPGARGTSLICVMSASGCVLKQNPSRERRGLKGGDGWRTKESGRVCEQGVI